MLTTKCTAQLLEFVCISWVLLCSMNDKKIEKLSFLKGVRITQTILPSPLGIHPLSLRGKKLH